MMVKKLVLIIRDYSYLRWLKLSNDPDYAWRQQKQMVICLLGCSWYFAVLMTFAIVSYKIGWSVYFPRPKAFMPVLLYGLLLFGPYVGFMWWWLDTLDDIPVENTMSYRKLGVITWSTVVIGVLLAMLMPPLLQELMPEPVQRNRISNATPSPYRLLQRPLVSRYKKSRRVPVNSSY